MIGFEQPYLLLTALISIPLLIKAFKIKENRYQSLLLLSKSLFIILAALALTQPFIEVTNEIPTDRNIDIINDDSKSSKLIPKQDLEADVNTQTNTQTIQEVKNSINKGNDVLLASDLQLNVKNLEEPLKTYNGSINTYKKELDTDYSVNIQGPREVVPGTEIEYKIKVEGTNTELPKPEVYLNDQKQEIVKLNKGEWSFTKEFESPGDNELTASIETEDEYEQNNQFYKAVEVIEKPKILVLGKEDTFSQQIKNIYDVEIAQSIPEDLTEYESLVIKESKYLNSDIKNYVAEGNGLLYTGKPVDSVITPLKQGTKIENDKEVEETADSIILIDASVSRQEGPLKKSKALTYNLLDSMPDSNNVGIAAYNRIGYELQPLTNLGINRDSLKETVSRIKPEGPTFHQEGLKTADSMAGENGNIIMITDGLLSRINRVKGVPEKTINTSKQLKSELIILDTNPDVNPDFLKNLTRETNGEYVTADNQGSLSFVFQAQQTEDRYSSLYKKDSTHFITRNNILKASIRPRQETEVKSGAQNLITTSQTPYLATWRYGLGRVAQTNDNNPNLDKIIREDPKTVSRILGWTVGEPKEEGSQIKENRKPTKVKIYSRKEGTLEKTTEHSQTGYKTYKNTKYDYNYDEEIQNIGYHQENINYIKNLTEGETVENPQKWLENRDTNNQLETVKEQKNLSKHILTLIAILFLVEIGLRKLKGKM